MVTEEKDTFLTKADAERRVKEILENFNLDGLQVRTVEKDGIYHKENCESSGVRNATFFKAAGALPKSRELKDVILNAHACVDQIHYEIDSKGNPSKNTVGALLNGLHSGLMEARLKAVEGFKNPPTELQPSVDFLFVALGIMNRTHLVPGYGVPTSLYFEWIGQLEALLGPEYKKICSQIITKFKPQILWQLDSILKKTLRPPATNYIQMDARSFGLWVHEQLESIKKDEKNLMVSVKNPLSGPYPQILAFFHYKDDIYIMPQRAAEVTLIRENVNYAFECGDGVITDEVYEIFKVLYQPSSKPKIVKGLYDQEEKDDVYTNPAQAFAAARAIGS